MYVIFADGGKQYRAEEGHSLFLETRSYEKNTQIVVDAMRFDDKGASPCKVELHPVESTRGPKILVFKKKRRHNYRRKNGHRQDLLKVTVAKVI